MSYFNNNDRLVKDINIILSENLSNVKSNVNVKCKRLMEEVITNTDVINTAYKDRIDSIINVFFSINNDTNVIIKVYSKELINNQIGRIDVIIADKVLLYTKEYLKEQEKQKEQDKQDRLYFVVNNQVLYIEKKGT